MKTSNQGVVATVAISSILVLSSCSNDNKPQDVAINFAAQVNGANFTCGDTYTGIGTGPDNFQVTDFRMYLHNVHIHDHDTGAEFAIELTQDGVWQLDDIVMLDFADASAGCTDSSPEMNSIVRGKVTVPSNINLSSTEVCFDVGLPADKNHIDEATAASPLNASGMLWAWKIGRKFVRIDGFGDPAGANEPFNIHLGSQGCPAGPGTAPPTTACTVPNTFEVCVDNFDVANSVIAVDPAFILEGNDVSTNLSTSGSGSATAKPGCQSFIGDDDCEEIMPRLSLDYAYGRSGIGVPSTYTGGQKMFSKQ